LTPECSPCSEDPELDSPLARLQKALLKHNKSRSRQEVISILSVNFTVFVSRPSSPSHPALSGLVKTLIKRARKLCWNGTSRATTPLALSAITRSQDHESSKTSLSLAAQTVQVLSCDVRSELHARLSRAAVLRQNIGWRLVKPG